MEGQLTSLENNILAGKYRLIKRLAGGGMGEVYLAEHILLKEPRAVKIIREQLLHNERNRKRFLREIKLTHMLSKSNPHIVLIYDDYGFEGSLGYYVMEYLKGALLAEKIYEQPGELPIAWCLTIAIELCEAMSVVHEAGVIHRDLKPSNIFLTNTPERDDFVKIVDFGIAKQLAMGTVLTEPGSFAGTLFYIAPEQLGMPIQGEPIVDEPDARADIYSLGCILYEMLTGNPPFRPTKDHKNKTLAFTDVLQQHLNAPPPKASLFRPDIPTSIEAILNLALQKQPKRRFQRMSDLADALRRVPAVEAVVKKHTTPPKNKTTPSTYPPLPETDPNPPPLADLQRHSRELQDEDLIDTSEDELSKAAFAQQNISDTDQTKP